MKSRLFSRLSLQQCLHAFVLLSFLLSPLQSIAAYSPPPAPPEPIESTVSSTGLYRTTVTLRTPADWTRLDELGVMVLEETTADKQENADQGIDESAASHKSAVILAGEGQLESLARLRFEPRATDELGALVMAHAAEKPWLVAGVRSLLERGLLGLADQPTAARQTIRPSEQSVFSALATLTSVDDDADGLTNTQEAWWCTDPMNPDSDGDGTSDGDEVQAAKDWLDSLRSSYPSTGKPFSGWPPDIANCRDDDKDSVPDLAERWELGLNMNRESTDRDKFDDGQELFGLTHCPGSGGFCGYGSLPRNEDWGVIFAEMPSWVEQPGNHPLATAFPVPEIDIVESSFHVETVTTVTTDHTIAEGTERSYSTAKTEGKSSSVANTESWNEWEEVSVSTPQTDSMSLEVGSRFEIQGVESGSSLFKEDRHITDTDVVTCGAGLALTPWTGGISAGVGCLPVIYKGAKAGLRYLDQKISSAAPPAPIDLSDEIDWDKVDVNLDDLDSGQNQCLIDGNGVVYSCNNEPGGLSHPDDQEFLTLQSTSRTKDNNDDSREEDLARGHDAALKEVTLPEQSGDPAIYSVKSVYNISYPLPRQVPVRTETSGRSWGGARTVTHTEYEEQTVTNGEAFSNSESWGTATAEDSSHTADLWFTYKIHNIGTEYSREIGDLAFNVYINDDPNPAVTYFVAPELGGDGKFHNFMPDEEHTYTSRRIPLTLNQMQAIDVDPACAVKKQTGQIPADQKCPGGKVRIVVEDFTYGIDELFYEDAVNAGVQVAIEDGTDDGDENIDTYLIPTWGEETVLDVLARYFPHTTDADGNLIAIWTPEYRSDTPAWCNAPQVTGAGPNRTLWCKHALSTADWWNVYTNGLGDGSEGFQDTPATPGSVALFRFNKDTDLDGYSDRSERRLGTDPNDPADHPQPELIAGLHSNRDGDHVTATLSLLNTGLYDAYGVEAVMIAPDDSVSITNNTVGGSGRVRALKQVIVGSRILLQSPLPDVWTQTDHARPAAAGYYTGTQDRTYTFTVQCGDPECNAGSGTWSLAWNDGTGNSGSLNFGAGYASPTFKDVGTLGVTLALYSGKVYNGEAFTVEARTPRDTFQYTINRDTYTEPVVIVSYNDPQGNHRFVIPPAAMNLSHPTDDLMTYSGEMLQDPGVEIVTTEALPPAGGLAVNDQAERTKDAEAPSGSALQGASSSQPDDLSSGLAGAATTNTLNLVVSNPTETTLTDAHLFLEFIDITGTVASEVPVTVTLPAGPTVVPVTWDTAGFDPPYDAEQDYIVMAFLTDYQGNILDTAGRPLSSFQADPRPAFAMDEADTLWDFGTAAQGTLLRRTVALGSVGYGTLLTHVENVTGLSISDSGNRRLPPGDVALYDLTLNTAELPEGPFERTISIRTSDPEHPTRTLTIRGEITPMPEDAPGGATLRPLDWTVEVAGDHTQGEWVGFTHTLGPDPQSLHPVKVYSQDYSTLHGVGKYATPFGQGTTSLDIFGDGSDGPLTVSSSTTYMPIHSPCSGTAGSYTLSANNASFTAGQKILIYQTQGTNAGTWEINEIASYVSDTITLTDPLKNSYSSGGSSKAQVVVLKEYTDVTVDSGVTWSVKQWVGANGTGGILAFLANGTVTVNGMINASSLGFSPGQVPPFASVGNSGEGTAGPTVANSSSANGNGGGGGQTRYGAGGGGNGTVGGSPPSGGAGGNAAGTDDSTNMAIGGGGGSAAAGYPGAWGGQGGAIVFMSGSTIVVGANGAITANGNSGVANNTGDNGGGGGGAGGSVLIKAQTASLGTDKITATGGSGGAGSGGGTAGGSGGDGRIRVEYCDTLSGSTNPPASTQKLNCYIAEQVEEAPYDHGRLNLPESFTGGRTYKVQYGRRYVFGGADEQTQSIHLPRQIYASASLDALVSNAGASSGDLNLSLDIGNDGTADWTHNATTDFPATLAVSDIVDALNAYLVSRDDVAWGADVDVPVRVVINRQADVILTNLVLSLQFNQPSTLALASIDTGADRPLDWTTVIPGDHSQGEAYDFTHTLRPEPASIHPCKVYDQSGSILKGVGKYCSDFGSGTLPYQVFGTGRDGDLVVGSGQTVYVDDVRTRLLNSAAAGENALCVASTSGLQVGDEILVIQTQGTGAGNYEFSTIANINSCWLTLQNNLQRTYTTPNSNAQVLRVSHYRDVTVQSGGTLTARAWDGSTGGILSFRASGTVRVDGVLSVSEKGFGGGPGTNPTCGGGNPNLQGESYAGTPSQSHLPNHGGGGGGDNETGHEHYNYAGGGGGGYGTAGSNGIINPGKAAGAPSNDPGRGGNVYGTTDLSTIFLGSGGGQGGNDWKCAGGGAGYGGAGGGIVLVVARALQVTGSISGDGQDGYPPSPPSGAATYGGGGGSGGSVLFRTQAASLGANRVTAVGGGGGYYRSEEPTVKLGGDGGVGRIRIEAQNLSGSTNPPASTEQVYFYVIEQIEQDPYTTTRLYLPESFTGGQTYIVQYGRRFTFAGAGEQTKHLRLNRQMYGTAGLDALVSNTGVASGNLNLCLDVGNDGACDFTHNVSTDFPATLNVTGLATALNNYMISRSDVAWGDPVDVPVRVGIDRQADVMLTNLALTPVGAKTRFLRLPARSYSDVTLSLQFTQPGVPNGPLSFTVDVGADGSIDWSHADTVSFPATLTSPNLAAAFNTYLTGRTGEVDVPIRIVPSPALDTNLVDFSATPADQPDISLSPSDISFDPVSPTETDEVTVTATLHNNGPAGAGPHIVSFFATPPAGFGETYIGSEFVPSAPSGSSVPASIQWNTLGFTGDVPVRVVVDPFNRLAETDEDNNQATANLTVLTRPDLRVPAIELSDPEPVAGQPVSVTLTISNAGQTDAVASVFELYDGNPESGGTVIEQSSTAVSGESETTVAFTWTPPEPGLHRLFAVSDRDDAVSEFDEGNNQTWRDVYVGLAGPIELDSGSNPDPAYTSELGYGYLDGQASAFCGTEPAQTLRSDADGEVQYRFDHLLPGHFYHLDVTLYECDGLGRQESILVDGFEITSQPENLVDGEVHELSIRLDPALYADRTVTVGIQEALGYDAVVAQVELHDVDYRYADAGGANDRQYAVGQDGILSYGWLDGVENAPWGTLPYQSRRIDLGDTDPSDDPDNELRYRFDGLDPNKRYQLHLTFYQGAGGYVHQTVAVDSVDTGAVVELNGAQRVDKTVDVPVGTYDDGTIVVRIMRTNATAGAFVNEIALEELTSGDVIPPSQRIDLHTNWNWISFALEPKIERDTVCAGVTPTSAFSSFTGEVLIDGQPAPVGTLVEAYSPRGDKVGCQPVSTAGTYPFMRVYGEEGATPGMRAGEPIIFKVNGVPATVTSGSVIWHNDKDTHTVDLAASGLPPVEKVLAGVSDVVEKLLCEVGTYLPLPANPIFNSCHTMQAGEGYLLRASGDATLTIEGDRVPTDTPLDLGRGWNWIGYLPACGLPVETALASIDGKFDLLHGETGTFQPPAGNPSNTLTQMGPGRGYMIRMTEAATLKYPAGACGATQTFRVSETLKVSSACEATPTPFFTVFHGTAMLGDVPYPAGTPIQALSPRDEVVGCGQVGENGQYPFLRVYGADEDIPGMGAGDAITFRINGRVVELDESPLWQNDRDVHRLDLRVEPDRMFLPLVTR